MAEKKGRRDGKAPGSLQVVILDNEGREWGRVHATPKKFSTGSVGFYGTGKVGNDKNADARYQVTSMLILIGSKPGEK
jgi:hypothetical protein